jgi:hypothetical protein
MTSADRISLLLHVHFRQTLGNRFGYHDINAGTNVRLYLNPELIVCGTVIIMNGDVGC